MFKEQLRKFGTKSNIKLLTVLTIVVFIVLTALTEITLDPSNFNIYTWFSNTILSIGISLCGMFLGEAIANDSLKSKPNGLYQKAIELYLEIQAKIKVIELYFSDFLLWFKEKETFNKQVDYLISKDIKEAKEIIKYLDIERLDELKLHPIELKTGKDSVIVRKKTEEQIQAIRKVLEGRISVKSSRSSYYLNIHESHSNSSLLEEGMKIDKRIENYKRVSRVSKIVISICVSILFATITFNELKDTALIVSITKLTIRLSTFLSCLYCGWQTEAEVVKELARKIENKTKVLNIFKTSYDSGEFKPTEYEDLARKEYEQYLNIKNINNNNLESEVTQNG